MIVLVTKTQSLKETLSYPTYPNYQLLEDDHHVNLTPKGTFNTYSYILHQLTISTTMIFMIFP